VPLRTWSSPRVLTPSTRDYDRGAKLGHYKRIPALGCVLVIDEPQRQVEVHRREADALSLEVVREGAIALPEYGGVLLLDDLHYLAEGG
jgi:hypothetical protein